MGWDHTTLREKLRDADAEELMVMMRDIHRVIMAQDHGRRAVKILRRLIGADESGQTLEPSDEYGYCLFCGENLTDAHKPDCPWNEGRLLLESLES